MLYFKPLRVNNDQQRLLYLAKLSFKVVGEIKSFQNGYKVLHDYRLSTEEDT
jgi:hypothetical protein